MLGKSITTVGFNFIGFTHSESSSIARSTLVVHASISLVAFLCAIWRFGSASTQKEVYKKKYTKRQVYKKTRIQKDKFYFMYSNVLFTLPYSPE